MSDGVTVKVNIADFRRELSALGQRLERRAVRAGLSDAGRVIARLAKLGAPRLQDKNRRRGRERGALAKSIRVIRSRKASVRRGEVGVFVGFGARRGAVRTARDAFYGRFLELGWYPRGPGRKLRGGVRSRSLARERNAAAGARKFSYPFLNPAFQQGREAAVRAFEARVVRFIERENARRGPA